MSRLSLLHCIHNVKVMLMCLASGVLGRVKNCLFLFDGLSVCISSIGLRGLSLSSWATSVSSITTLIILLNNLLFELQYVATLGCLRHRWSSSYRLLFCTFLIRLLGICRKLLNQMPNATVWKLYLLHFLVLVCLILLLAVLIKHRFRLSMHLFHRILLTDKIWILGRLLLLHE